MSSGGDRVGRTRSRRVAGVDAGCGYHRQFKSHTLPQQEMEITTQPELSIQKARKRKRQRKVPVHAWSWGGHQRLPVPPPPAPPPLHIPTHIRTTRR
jgi:hypothetical protein